LRLRRRKPEREGMKEIKKRLTELEKALVVASEEMVRAGEKVLADPTVSRRVKVMVENEIIAHEKCLEVVGLKHRLRKSQKGKGYETEWRADHI
jgi:ribosomal protein L21